MKYDFDKEINRYNTNSLKWDFAQERNKPIDAIPMWVADMDFETDPKVIEALVKASTHGIYGYSDPKPNYFDQVYNWYNKRFDYKPEREWLALTPGVVFAIAVAIQAYTKKGDKVLVQMPVYYPFFDTVKKNNRLVVENDLVYKDGKYTIDFQDFEEKIKNNGVKLFLLCSPHNPVMRVWTKEELQTMGDICKKYGVIVLADEIHSDLVYGHNKHIVFTDIDPSFGDFTIVTTAPTKTFNLASLQISNNFISNTKLRNQFESQKYKMGYHQQSIFGLVGCIAAYQHGEEWYQELIKYLQQNVDIVKDFTNRLPGVYMPPVEATYLLWLDFKEYVKEKGIEQKELEKKILDEAKVWLHNGQTFGKEQGNGFMRINIGCTKAKLTEALDRIEKALF